MGQHQNLAGEAAAIHALAPAGRLFVAQYRLWLAGYSTHDPVHLDCAFDILLRFVTRDSARVLYSEFHLFMQTLIDQTRRTISWRAGGCRCLCRDEILALRLVAASQSGDLADEVLAASELIANDYVKPFVSASRSLGQALLVKGLLLAPAELDSADEAAPPGLYSRTLQ
ncbi:MAG: hypothetical protein L0Y50_03215 [Beijerinckiaceae bacterium]|nr:hypothetical protein [Beijerinckiaceae bacterium]